MRNNDFWYHLVAQDLAAIREEYADLWKKAGAGGELSPEQAKRTLHLLFLRTHIDMLEHGRKDYFPTKQGGHQGRLAQVKHLHWVDHATAGVSGWGTLDWFSSKERQHLRKFHTEAQARRHYGSRKPGATVFESPGKNKPWRVSWKGLAGAVTHFVVHMDGAPFYLLDIANRCWAEPKRNRDGIHVEMVNPLVCHLKDQEWRYWAGRIPQNMLSRGQVPVELDTPFRGAQYMMPYTWQQVITNIKLKRLCIAATDGRMALARMSNHTDWRKSKFDMGPLWPRDIINDAAFDTVPIDEYGFMRQFVLPENADDIVDAAELRLIDTGEYDLHDPEIDVSAEDDDIDSTVEIQQALLKLYGNAALPQYGADGDLGAETCRAVRHFQEDWNKNEPYDRLKVDGIPGTETCDRLEQALALGQGFKTRAID